MLHSHQLIRLLGQAAAGLVSVRDPCARQERESGTGILQLLHSKMT